MSEKTNINPEDLLNMLQHAERLGAYKALNWLCYEFTDDMTVKDIVDLVKHGIGSIGEELWSDFKREHWITTSIREQIEKRQKQKVKVNAK
jgi:20S proteasome alpha/beta subunit